MTPLPKARASVEPNEKCAGWSVTTPATPMMTSGSIFSAVVTSWTRPALPTPHTLIPVSSQTVATATVAAAAGVRTMEGKNGSR